MASPGVTVMLRKHNNTKLEEDLKYKINKKSNSSEFDNGHLKMFAVCGDCEFEFYIQLSLSDGNKSSIGLVVKKWSVFNRLHS